MNKNYGSPPVSGYSDPTGRAWETVVFQAGKPVTDRELNLSQDVDGGAAQGALRCMMPSGWISDDALTESTPLSKLFVPTTQTNRLVLRNDLLAHVNGWLVKVRHTGVRDANQVTLPNPPTTAGTARTDLVILEVWRRLISVSPSTAGKSPTGRIWQEGNVATDNTQDATLNYPDDLLVPTMGAGTTSRVQIQYRLRVISGVDLFQSPSGMTSSGVVANTVPATAAASAGTATTFTYESQSPNGDPGLWRAGDGNPANNLGTVDGYIYALPLVGVFRRNSATYNRRTNQNGAPSYPTTSTRPDGLHSNIIHGNDLVDLRNCVSPVGWSYPEVLEKNVNLILDNTQRVEIARNAFGGGYGNAGTSVLISNEIGGSPTEAGPSLVHQSFDSIRRRFSARPILEVCTVRIPTQSWANGETVTINPTSVQIYPWTSSFQNWSSLAPAGTMFTEIIKLGWLGSTKSRDAMPYVQRITGLGTSPATSIVIHFNNNVTALALGTASLYVTLAVMYPPGSGLTHTPVETYPNSIQVVSSTTPPGFSSYVNAIDASHREVLLSYDTAVINFGVSPPNSDMIPLLERATSISEVVVGSTVVTGWELDESRMWVRLAAPSSSVVTVRYRTNRAVQMSSNAQFSVSYRAAAPQMAPPDRLGTELKVFPRLCSDKLFSLTVGAGSQDEAYPFPHAYVQTGGIIPREVGEIEVLLGSADISVGNFDAKTGFLSLPIYIPMAATPGPLVLRRNADDIDAEGRSYFTSAEYNGTGYWPNAFAQDLSSADRHKNVYAMLAEIAEDSLLGPKGQLVVLLFIRYAEFDDDNGVFLASEPSSNTSISVFRVKGLLLNKRAN